MKAGHAHASQIENIKKNWYVRGTNSIYRSVSNIKIYIEEEEDKASKNPAVWQVRLKWLNRAAIE